MDEAKQEKLGELLKLVGFVKELNNRQYFTLFKVATNSLLSNEPNLALAESIIKTFQLKIKKNRFIFFNNRPSTKVIQGLFILLYIAFPIGFWLIQAVGDHKAILGIKSKIFGIIAFFGTLGSVVSIMFRIHDFDKLELEKAEPSVMFLTGFFKPIIGTSLALLVYATLMAGIIPI